MFDIQEITESSKFPLSLRIHPLQVHYSPRGMALPVQKEAKKPLSQILKGHLLMAGHYCCGVILDQHPNVEPKKLFKQSFALTDRNEIRQDDDMVLWNFEDQALHQPNNVGIKLMMVGTPFQIKVWRALLDIPVGITANYGDIAAKVGLSKGSRAVGQAIGKNPLAVVVPCHRVIYSTGEIGHYRWGEAIKRMILAHEQPPEPHQAAKVA